MVKVPGVVGYPITEAANILREEGLELAVLDEESQVPHPKVPKYHIISQRPKAGQVVAALAKKMTPRQIRKAESKAAGFRPGPNEVFADRPTVIYVQQSLNTLGFDAGPVDGIAGPRTHGAIREFESRAKLAGDGGVSPELLRGLLAEQNQPG